MNKSTSSTIRLLFYRCFESFANILQELKDAYRSRDINHRVEKYIHLFDDGIGNESENTQENGNEVVDANPMETVSNVFLGELWIRFIYRLRKNVYFKNRFRISIYLVNHLYNNG